VTMCRTEETLGEARILLEPSKLQVYVWQIPFMLLTISIILFVVGLNLWVFEAATKELSWGDDRKVCFPSMLDKRSSPWLYSTFSTA